MNAIKLLKEDHQKVKSLFRDFEAEGGGASRKRQDLASKIFIELELHTQVEEEIFYPAVKTKGGKEGKELVAAAIEEHREVTRLIEDLRELELDDPEYNTKFEELITNVENHIEEEESEMLPQAEAKLGAALESLGREMEEQKEMASVE